jgi:hypothetical protein
MQRYAAGKVGWWKLTIWKLHGQCTPACEAQRRPHAHERCVRSRPPHRVACVRAQAHQSKARRHACARASLLEGSGDLFHETHERRCNTFATHLQHIQLKRGCAGTMSSCRDVVSSSNRATAVKRQAAQRLPCSGENKNAKHILVRNDRAVKSYLDAFENRGIGALYLKQAGSAGRV